MQQRREIEILIVLPLITLLLTSCASSRVLKAPYSKVADLAKKEFNCNSWTKSSTEKSEMKERENELEIEYYEWKFPNIKIYCEVEAVKKSEDTTKLYIYVKDCNSWWYPFNFNPGMATDLLDAFEKQLKWYKFGKMKKPWDDFNKEK